MKNNVNQKMKSSTNLFLVLLFVIYSSGLLAQSALEVPESDKATRLNVAQSLLESKLIERKTLREKIVNADPDDVPDLETELQEINLSIGELRESFEQIAIGEVDLSLFSESTEEFNWRTEMTQVMMPIIRNLQGLTEKPRKIEAFRTEIKTSAEQLQAANEALLSIEDSMSTAVNEETRLSLAALQSTWQDETQELQRKIESAQTKLNNLQKSDGNFFEKLKSGTLGFITGRGLTLLIALIASLSVWFAAKFISKLLQARGSGEAVKTYRTRQRLVQYGFNVLTFLLMMIAVIVVFYVRGDVLLLGVSFLVAGAAVLGLRHTIPKFISEAKLLLNLGSIREDERVVYNGLPFKVTSLNMYSILKNPELTGVVRLPLESMMGMISRPSAKEVWFPASRGDYILLSDGKLLEVIGLTTELIQLQNLVGTKTSIPAAEFYNMTFDNLSRGEMFSIVGTFGVGYAHQGISNDSIPTTLQKAVADALANTDIAEHVQSVAVELKEAGASSLDYWVCVTMSSAAVRSYFKINRIVQQTCVATCTKENWDIPFPQLTIHNS